MTHLDIYLADETLDMLLPFASGRPPFDKAPLAACRRSTCLGARGLPPGLLPALSESGAEGIEELARALLAECGRVRAVEEHTLFGEGERCTRR